MTDSEAHAGELAEVGQISQELQSIDAQRRALYARRLELFQALRRAEPPVMHRVIAEAAGVSEVMVIRSVNKADAA